MPLFRYEATDLVGAVRSDCLEARDVQHALCQIRECGWQPISVAQEDAPSARSALARRAAESVICAWCRACFSQRPASWECPECGGPLPLPASPDRGPEPPSAPRSLPARRVWDPSLLFSIKFGAAIGGFSALFAGLMAIEGEGRRWLWFPLLFAACGVALALGAFRATRRREYALRSGQAVPGFVESATLASHETLANGQSPFVVRFQYSVNGVSYFSEAKTLDGSAQHHYQGEPIWVVSVLDQPECCSIWPPLA